MIEKNKICQCSRNYFSSEKLKGTEKGASKSKETVEHKWEIRVFLFVFIFLLLNNEGTESIPKKIAGRIGLPKKNWKYSNELF